MNEDTNSKHQGSSQWRSSGRSFEQIPAMPIWLSITIYGETGEITNKGILLCRRLIVLSLKYFMTSLLLLLRRN